jgi:hypothetical protein
VTTGFLPTANGVLTPGEWTIYINLTTSVKTLVLGSVGLSVDSQNNSVIGQAKGCVPIMNITADIFELESSTNYIDVTLKAKYQQDYITSYLYSA